MAAPTDLSRRPSGSPSDGPSVAHLPWRSRVALAAGRAVAGASKLARMGTGSVVGGNVALRLEPHLLPTLLRGRRVAVVSGTNGKTTTTALLTAALALDGPVVSNSLGANMPPGIVAALDRAEQGAAAVVEVDERYLATVLAGTDGATVVLLNLSRDQLDRSHEVRRIADDWRAQLAARTGDRIVANADDPLVVWAASGGTGASDASVVWVGTGGWWTLDAAGCPQCAGRIEFGVDGRSWACSACDFARPDPAWQLDADRGTAVGPDGTGHELGLDLPGRANAANATMVLAAAVGMGLDPGATVRAMRTVRTVAGRYRIARIGGVEVRMLLAKNPAGWQEAIDMLAPAPRPVVAAINARIADGRDPSWLWDVPYERLAGRYVVATGERRHDLAVRLRYAEVDHGVAEHLVEAVTRAAEHAGTREVDLIANYTAFQDYLDEVGR